jgi:hypothetical protein
MRNRHPILKRFIADWATIAIIRQFLGNQRQKRYNAGTAVVPAKYKHLKANADKRDHSTRRKSTSTNPSTRKRKSSSTNQSRKRLRRDPDGDEESADHDPDDDEDEEDEDGDEDEDEDEEEKDEDEEEQEEEAGRATGDVGEWSQSEDE